MVHIILQKYVYKYAINIIAKEMAMLPQTLIDKINGVEEFTGTEIIKISKLLNIDNPEYIFCKHGFC